MASFSAQVKGWTKKAKRTQVAVVKNSTQAVIDIMQTPRGKGGRMRVDTGFLRNSLVGSTSSMPTINSTAQPEIGKSYGGNDGQISLVIAKAAAGQTMFFGYTASYARYREYGTTGQAPDAFVRGAAQQWQDIVSAEVAKLS